MAASLIHRPLGAWNSHSIMLRSWLVLSSVTSLLAGGRWEDAAAAAAAGCGRHATLLSQSSCPTSSASCVTQ
jgi:hypothetical protein